MDTIEADEEAWCAERRGEVAQYLRAEGLNHGQIGDVPAWFVAPIISVWAIESLRSPGSVGWWVACGDIPTDYCSAENCRHPRLALKRIAERWQAQIDGSTPGHTHVGDTGLRSELMTFLQTRAKLLLGVVRDDDAWLD